MFDRVFLDDAGSIFSLKRGKKKKSRSLGRRAASLPL